MDKKKKKKMKKHLMVKTITKFMRIPTRASTSEVVEHVMRSVNFLVIIKLEPDSQTEY